MNKFNLIQRKGFVISPVEKLFSGFLLFFLLADMSYSYAQNPGGVTPAAWYRADAPATVFSDAGVTQATDNIAVQQWNEFKTSSFNLIQPTAASKPIFSNATTLANFNPTVTFDGSNDWMQFTAAVGVNVIDRATGTLLTAGYMNEQKRSGFAGFNASMDYPGLHVFSDNKLLFFTAGGPGYQGLSAEVMRGQTYFTSGASWQNGVTYAAATVSLNGTRLDYSGAEIYNVDAGTTTRDLQIGADNNWGAFSGQLNEVLVFEDRLTSGQLDQVETYLAIKYGTTYAAGLNDYKSSAGTPVWTAAANASYKANIAGIARDDNGALHQKQSWSTNTGTQVLISTTGLANTNAANATGLTSDGQYLIWGDNGLVKTPSVSIVGITGISHRFAAIWKVQNTGSVGPVRVAWPKSLANISLLQSTDEVFTSADIITSMSGETTINNILYNYADVTFSDGQYFTIAGKVASPGGVSGPAVWLKADGGTTLVGSSVSGWLNYGNSGGVAGQLPRTATVNWALPKYGTNEHNFNPAIIDDVANTNDGSLLLADVFPESAHRPLFSFVLQSHNTMSSTQSMISYTNLKQTTNALEAPYMAAYNPPNSKLWFYWQGRYDVAPTLPNSIVRYPNIPSVNAFYVPQFVPGTPHTTTFGMNGATVNGNTYNGSGTAYPFGNQLFIFGDGGGNNPSGGKISEVISYDKVLTTTERQQINSYLAIKYGISLTNDAGTATTNYLNSAASIVWDATTNSGYDKNIAGIANDTESTLNQKQSKSVNAGSQVLIGTTGLANTNALNAVSLTNAQYLVWGDNGLARVPAVAITGVPGVNYRFAAVWKVQNTGSVGTVRVAWPTGLVNVTLVQSTDPTFATVSSFTDMSANTTTINGVGYNYADVTLASGAYFTFATQLNGPGGVSLDLRVWLKSDAGFTPADWTDFSGNSNNYTQTNSSRQPFTAARQYNFNPIIDFGTTGADARFMVVPSGKPYSANGTSSTIFTASLSKSASGYTDIIGFGATTTGSGLMNANLPTFTKQDANLVLYPYTTAPSLPAIELNRLYLDDVSYTIGVSGIKYGQNGQIATVAQTFAAGNALHASGSILGAQPEVRNGLIGEVIAYQRDLSEDEKQRVRSYVAIKYGLTLPHNYIASNATTHFWNMGTNTGYNNNIAGIARDDYGSLNQRQSQSINPGNQVLISTTGFATTNAMNTTMLTDQQFLVWGDNGLAKGPTVSIAGIAGVNYRFASIWKIQNTASVGTVRVAWPKGYANLKLIQSPDASFDAGDVITDMSNTQVVNDVEYVYADVSFTDGYYFTFAAFIQAPGGVTNNLSYWYRADKFATASGEGAVVTDWTDFTSGTVSAQLGTNELPVLSVGSSTNLNFNPGINFTTVQQTLGNLSVRTFNNNSYDVFTLTKEGLTAGSNGRIFSSLIDNSLLNGNIGYWDAFGDMADSRTERMNTALSYRYLATIGGTRPATHPSIVYHNLMNTTTGKAINGAAVATSTAHTAIGSLNGGHAFGSTQFSGNSSDNAGFTGYLGEVIVYGNGNITGIERNKVESYLSIKYGITLDNTNNYTTSQDVVVWNASANAGYYNNVAGIGKDSISALEQKQSRSQHTNTNNQVIIGLGEIAATNEANIHSLTDGQFLVWGDNGNTQAMTNTAGTFTTFSYQGGTGNGRRMNRIWKVQNTNVTNQLLIRFPTASVGTTMLPAGEACANYAILFADDAGFTTNVTALPLAVNGTDYEVTHSFPNGASYFSFARLTPLNNGAIYLPGIVENTVSYTDNCGVGEWKHYHKTGNVSQKMLGFAQFTNTELDNLAVTITPEGAYHDDGTIVTSLMPRVATVVNNNVAPLSTGKVRIYYSADELAESIVAGAQTNSWVKYEGSADELIEDVYSDGRLDAGKTTLLTPAASGMEDGVNYVEFHNISSFSGFAHISSTQQITEVLPVKLSYFKAAKENEVVRVSWGTATEQNNKGFYIERSTDAATWTGIGFVNSKAQNGNSYTPTQYDFVDRVPLPGVSYYRLKQIDFDGKYDYSTVRIVHAAAATVTAYRIYPNPVLSNLTIDGLNGSSRIRIVDKLGKVITNMVTAANEKVRQLDLSSLPHGVYFIIVTDNKGKTTTRKIVRN